MSPTRDTTLPRGALVTAGLLVGTTLLATSVARLTHTPPSASPALLRASERIAPVSTRDLLFADKADGSVGIVDAKTGQPAGGVAAGSQSGFIRGVMRGLARDRHKMGLGPNVPFRLTLWHDGELSLLDLGTGRTIELTAFGGTNRAAFAALLPAGGRS